jgi:hypothetical protein
VHGSRQIVLCIELCSCRIFSRSVGQLAQHIVVTCLRSCKFEKHFLLMQAVFVCNKSCAAYMVSPVIQLLPISLYGIPKIEISLPRAARIVVFVRCLEHRANTSGSTAPRGWPVPHKGMPTQSQVNLAGTFQPWQAMKCTAASSNQAKVQYQEEYGTRNSVLGFFGFWGLCWYCMGFEVSRHPRTSCSVFCTRVRHVQLLTVRIRVHEGRAL